MFEKFRDWIENRHEYAKQWKERTGGKVLGYFCTYVPEEILYAANVLPVRILGSHEPQDVTEPHIFGMFCPFCRDCLAQGLKGRFDYLDGIMIAQSCLHIRQAYTSWEKHIPVEFSYYLCMPHHVQSPHAKPYLRGELVEFKKAVEEWTGVSITDDMLGAGINEYNRNRDLMWKMYNMRKDPAPSLTGLEAMELAVSNQMVDKKEHSVAIEETISALSGRELGKENATRLMIIGSEDDDREFMNMVESLNAVVVIDDHCTGTRYFWNKVEQGPDLLTAIANRYVDRNPCPTKDWPQRERLNNIMKLAKEYDVKGAIVIQQKFCDPHELDIPAIQKSLDGIGIPTLFLEFDVTVPVGQFKVRVEAFLEMIEEEDLF